MANWLVNEAPKLTVLLMWLGINTFLFGYTFHLYEYGEAYIYTRELLGSCRSNIRRQLDKSIGFHQVVAYMIILQTVIHIVAHLFNIERYHESYSPAAGSLLTRLSSIGTNSSESYLNPIRTYDTNPTKELLRSTAGVTGIIITVTLVLMATSSAQIIMRSFYEVFWFAHHLFIIFFIGLIIHGSGRIVRGQTSQSLQNHNVTYCRDHHEEWGDIPECPLPQFSGNEPVRVASLWNSLPQRVVEATSLGISKEIIQYILSNLAFQERRSWKWVLGPIFLYICERLIRFYRSRQKVVITKVIVHPSKVLELQMKKQGFKMKPGQYIFLHCPSISHFEWHPFTLTSASDDEHFSIHVKVLGDWTSALYDACGANLKGFREPWKMPRVAVDGPFGTASIDVFCYEVSVLIAAGIGVTPFASILKSIWFKYSHQTVMTKVKRVYFYWICRDTHSFEWFADLLHSLEMQMMKIGKSQFLSYHIFLTGWDDYQAAHIALHYGENEDVITGLKQKTFYGRPNWNNEFKYIADDNPGSSIGVFFCGPKDLSSVLHKMCNYYSSLNPRGVQFYYNKENI